MGVNLGPDEGDDPLFRRRQVAVQIDLKHRLDAGGVGDRLGGLLGDVGLGEGFQRDKDLGLRLAQDGRDLLGLKQRVDRVDDARHRAAQKRGHGFQRVRQQIGDGIALAHAKAAEEVRGAGDLFAQLGPAERDGGVVGAGEQLKADRGAGGKPCRNRVQKAVKRDR